MRGKIFKNLAALMLSVVLAVSGVAVTVCAAEVACSHSNYSVENRWNEYVSGPDYLDYHWVFVIEERYCYDCGAYYDVTVYQDTEDHDYNGYVAGAECRDCGHVKK